jgi:hypothetical protein
MLHNACYVTKKGRVKQQHDPSIELTQTNQQDRTLEIVFISLKFTEFPDSTNFLHSRVLIKHLSTPLS